MKKFETENLPVKRDTVTNFTYDFARNLKTKTKKCTLPKLPCKLNDVNSLKSYIVL